MFDTRVSFANQFSVHFSPSMADIDTLRTQLATASTFVQNQASVLTPSALEVHSRAVVDSLKEQLRSMQIDFDAANTLVTVIQQSAFSNDLRSELSAFVGQRAVASQVRGSVIRRNPQSIANPCSVFTKSDWECFSNQRKSQGQKVTCAVHRLYLLGVLTLSEAALRKVAAMLACAIWPNTDPSPQQTHALVKEIKDHMKTMDLAGRPQLPYLVLYPEDPTDFPILIFNSAYSEEQPVSVTLDRLAEMTRRIVLRSSNHSVMSPQTSGSDNAVQNLLHVLQTANHGNALQIRTASSPKLLALGNVSPQTSCGSQDTTPESATTSPSATAQAGSNAEVARVKLQEPEAAQVTGADGAGGPCS